VAIIGTVTYSHFPWRHQGKKENSWKRKREGKRGDRVALGGSCEVVITVTVPCWSLERRKKRGKKTGEKGKEKKGRLARLSFSFPLPLLPPEPGGKKRSNTASSRKMGKGEKVSKRKKGKDRTAALNSLSSFLLFHRWPL